jgi:hypothetical protein
MKEEMIKNQPEINIDQTEAKNKNQPEANNKDQTEEKNKVQQQSSHHNIIKK